MWIGHRKEIQNLFTVANSHCQPSRWNQITLLYYPPAQHHSFVRNLPLYACINPQIKYDTYQAYAVFVFRGYSTVIYNLLLHVCYRAGMMWVFMAQIKFQLLILIIWQIVELFWTITMCCQFVHPHAVLLWLADIPYTLVSQAFKAILMCSTRKYLYLFTRVTHPHSSGNTILKAWYISLKCFDFREPPTP